MTAAVIDLAALAARPRVALALDMARRAGLAPAGCSPAIFDPHHRVEPDPSVVGLADMVLRLAAVIDHALAEEDWSEEAVSRLRALSEPLLGPFPSNAA